MDEAAQIRAALATIMSPGADAGARRAAQALCDAVQTHARAAEYGLALASSPSEALAVRVFGLNTVERVVRTRLELGSAEALRDAAWALLPLAVSAPPAERRILQQKAAALVAQLAVRIWPQYWPELFVDLQGLLDAPCAAYGRCVAPSDAAWRHAEMALQVVRTVVDEVHPGDAGRAGVLLDDERRVELQRALAVVLPPLLCRVRAIVPMAVQMRLADGGASGASLLREAAAAYAACAQWAPNISDGEDASSVVGACASALGGLFRAVAALPSDEACDVLDAVERLASRAYGKEAERRVASGVVDAVLPEVQGALGALAQALSRGGPQAEWEEACGASYDVFKRTADAASTLFAVHVAAVHPPMVTQATLRGVLDVIFGLWATPSLLVQCMADAFWAAACRGSAGLLGDAAVVERLPLLIAHVLATGAASVADEARRRPLNAADFAGASDDFDALWSAHCARSTELLRALACAHGCAVVAALVGHVDAHVSGPLFDPAQCGASAVQRQWASLMGAVDAVGRAVQPQISAPGGAETPLAAHVLRLGASVVGGVDARLGAERTPADYVSVATVWATGLRGLLPALGALDSPLHGAGVRRLLAWALEDAPSSAGDADGSRGALRGRAGTVLQRVAQGGPAHFARAWAFLSGEYAVRLGDLGACGRGRGVRLLSELVLIGLADAADGSRGAVLQSVFVPLVERLGGLVSQLGAQSLGAIASGGAPDKMSYGASDNTSYGASDSTSGKAPGMTSDASSGGDNTVRLAWANVLCVLLSSLRRLHAVLAARPPGTDGDGPAARELGPLVSTGLVPALCGAVDAALRYALSEFAERDDLRDDAGVARAARLAGLDAAAVCDLLEQLGSGREPALWPAGVRAGLLAVRGLLFSLAPGSDASVSLIGADGRPCGLLLNCGTYALFQWAQAVRLALAPLAEAAVVYSPAVRSAVVASLEVLGLGALSAAWRGLRALADAEPPGAESAAAQARRETYVLTATSALLSFVHGVFVPVCERDKRPDPVLDVGLALYLGGVNVEPLGSSGPPPIGSVDEAVRLAQVLAGRLGVAGALLGDGAVALALVRLVAAALSWRPSLALARALPAVSRWLPALLLVGADWGAVVRSGGLLSAGLGADAAAVQALLFGEIGAGLVDALGLASLGESHGPAAAVLAELFKWALALRVPGPEAALAARLGPAEASAVCAEIRAYLCSADARRAPARATRTRVRAILVRAVQPAVLAAAGVSSVAPRLPDRLVILGRMASLDSAGRAGDVDVSSLFD